MKKFLFLFLLVSEISFAQDGYKLDFKIKGQPAGPIYLGFYQQDKTYVKDTAQVSSTGAFSFDGRKRLPEGVYFVLQDNTQIMFELVVGKPQRFSIETDAPDYYKNMIVKGDDDNQLFFENRKLLIAANNEAEPAVKILRDSTLSNDQKKQANDTYQEIGKRVTEQQEKIIASNPQSVTARIVRMNKPINVPDPPRKANGNIDSTFQFKYYRKHYFDNFDLGDEAMLRVPKVFYWEKVKDYLTRLHVQQPDTLMKAIDGLVAIAKRNQDTYKYLVWNCVIEYQTPKIMGLDQVYVKLVDKYIASGEMDYWLDKKTISNMVEYADKLRRAPIGSVAPNLIMQDQNLQPRSMYDMKNKYVIVYFFKPSCGHCREETPKLVTLYNTKHKKFDFEVFAVSTDSSMKEMRQFIKDMNTTWTTVNGPRTYLKEHFSKQYYAELTPTVYILDNKKKIIARRLDVDQIEDFLTNYEKMNAKKTVTP